jgi:hypothetical protein
LLAAALSAKPRVQSLSDWGDLEGGRDLGEGDRYIEHFAARDLRRACAKLRRKNGGDLEQIKFLLGHFSIQTTEVLCSVLLIQPPAQDGANVSNTLELSTLSLVYEEYDGRYLSLEENLGHHSLVLVLQKMAMEERHPADDRIGEVHNQVG